MRLFFAIILVVVFAEVKSEVKVFTHRLKPGQEIVSSLKYFAAINNLQAASVVSGLGFARSASLYLAFSPGATKQPQLNMEERLELVALSGTVSQAWTHLHATLGRNDGSVIAGHVSAMVTDVTAEIVLLENYDEVYFVDKDKSINVLGVKKVLIPLKITE